MKPLELVQLFAEIIAHNAETAQNEAYGSGECDEAIAQHIEPLIGAMVMSLFGGECATEVSDVIQRHKDGSR